MRRVLVAACLTGGLVLTPLPARADSTYQPRTTVGAVAGAGAQHVTVDVPAGTTPTRLAGTLNTDGRLKGTVTILVGEREIATVGDPDPRHIDAPLSAADVVGGALTIGLRYDPLTDNRRCTLPDSSVVTLDHLTLALSGEPAEPTSIGNFFAPGVNAVSVVVPEQASDDILQAGLSAVAALTHRYGERAQVRLSTRPASSGAEAREVDLVAGSGPTAARVDTSGAVPKLTLSGRGDKLAAAAAALGSEDLALAADADATRLAQTGTDKGSLTRTLDSLGRERIQLGGYGRSTGSLQVTQSDFAGPVSGARVTLKGVTSEMPRDVDAMLSVYWNDFLIGSRTLTGSVKLDWSLRVPRTLLRSGNGLTMQLDAIPHDGDCRGAAPMPIRVDIDGRASVVRATRGSSAEAGFAQFPQVLGGHLPIAIGGSGETRTAQAIDAARLVAALQRVNATPLDVSLVSARTFLSSGSSGLLVGATADQADRLKAPLRLDAFRQISGNDTTFDVETTSDFGVLEAFRSGGRHVLMLGGWKPGSTTFTKRIAGYADTRRDGWGSLSGDLIVMSAGSKTPVTLASTTLVPQAKVTSEYRGYARWIALGIAVVALIIGARALFERRRRAKVRAYVDAQEAEDGHGNSP